MVLQARPTCSWTAHERELACNVDNTSSLIRNFRIMAREWILLEHSSQLGTGGEPTTLIVDIVDLVEIVR